jgi:hypothetical protein
VKLLSESPFAAEKTGQRSELPKALKTFLPPTENEYRVSMSEYLRGKEMSFSASYESAAVLPGFLERHALDVTEGMLSEALEDEVRESRGWTYSIQPTLGLLGDICDFSVHCSALEIEALPEIQMVVNDCITSLSSREDLFRKIRDEFVAEKKLSDPTAKRVCRGALLDLSESQRIITLTEEIEELSALTMDDIHAVLHWLTPERRWTRVVQP